MEEKTTLDVQNLNIYFKTADGEQLHAVRDLTFQVKRGELLGIVGESGCGKSVSSLAIMGLLEFPGVATSDHISLLGKDISKYSREEMRKLRGSELAMIFQEPMTSLNPLFTVGAQISDTIELHQKCNKQEAKEQEAREQAAIRSILFTAEQEAQRIKREAEAKAQRMRNEIAACKAGISYAEYQNRISRSMGYGYGSYCGD